MLCLSLVRLKRKGNFKWIEIVISLLIPSLTFHLESNDRVWTNFMYLFGHESKTKDSMYDTHLNFQSFFSGEKV